MTRAHSIPILLASLTLVGCAGDEGRLSKVEYAEKVRSVYAEVQEAFRQTDVPLSDLADRVEDAQAKLRDAADELESLEPPEDVEAENAQIVDGFRSYADELDRLRNAAERGDQRTIDDFNAGLATRESVELIAEAAERIKFKGYDLGDIAEE